MTPCRAAAESRSLHSYGEPRSLSANIVEGTAKDSQPELRRFLVIALGSAAEAEYHLLVARDTNLLDPARYDRLAEQVVEIRRMLSGLIKRVTISIDENAVERRHSVPNQPRAEPVHTPHGATTDAKLENFN
ncbi:MAG TPA: four helix bundle protein [Gemmatimonadaceae bacterium]